MLCEVRNLSKGFLHDGKPLPVLDKMKLEVLRGQFVAILGPSGCGKTTLLRIIAGLEEPSEGSVLIDGQPVSAPCADVGMVFQAYSSFPWLTVRENIAFGLRLRSKQSARKQGIDDRVSRMLDLVGLEDFADAYPATLSGGMKQRVAVARALVLEPRLLLLDEPFGALDAQTRTLLQEQLIDIWSKLETSVCLVTHDVEESLLLADRIYVLSRRPASVRTVIENPLGQPRQINLRTSSEFLRKKIELFELIRQDATEAMRGA